VGRTSVEAAGEDPAMLSEEVVGEDRVVLGEAVVTEAWM
jgi:hypothetical protein